jgi:hypothetical protein
MLMKMLAGVLNVTHELRSWQGSRDFPSPNAAAADERDDASRRSPSADDTARPSVLEKKHKILLKGVTALDLRAFRDVERIWLRVGNGMDGWVRFNCDGVGLNREIGCVEVNGKDCWSPNACAEISRREWRGELVQRLCLWWFGLLNNEESTLSGSN